MKWLQNRAHKERPNADCLKTVLIVAIAVLGGCSHYVMPTPRIYSSGDQAAFGPLDPKLESNEVDILYVTDRQPATEDPDDPKYGYKRSPSVAFGSAVVPLGKYDSWEDLTAYSSRPTRAGESPRLELIRTSEIQRLPSTPYHYQVLDGGSVELDPGDVAARQESVKEFTGEIQRRLALTPRKEVYVFVHGVATKFPRAVENVAQVWHFLGREGVPICAPQ